MPWQQLVADVGLEYEITDTGLLLPYYREIIVTIPRQNGKTTLTLAFEVQRATGWLIPQSIAYTAQTGKDAREKMLNDQAPLLQARNAPIRPLIRRVYKGIGNEAIVFKTGSRIFCLNSGEDSGHGKTLDLGVIDESFADEDDRREQAMLPAMLTRPSAQILNISTAGTDRSPFLRRKVDAGRAAVAAGETRRIAYFEWSAEDSADPDDPATWWSCMPALGYTITEETVRHMKSTMTDGDFLRAGLNLWTVSDERVIPANVWDAVCSPSVVLDGSFALAIDVAPDRASASIAVADTEDRVELIETRPGVGWVVDDIAELALNWGAPVAIDGNSPAASLIQDIEDRGVQVHAFTPRELANACGSLYDAIADGRVKIRHHPLLDLAAAAARKREMNDTWIWGRKNSSEDVTPLIAATMARDEASRLIEDTVWAAWG